MRVSVVSIFPEMFEALVGYGVIGRAVEQAQVTLHLSNPRDYATDRHAAVDDRPYGGGPGMLMKIETLEQAIVASREAVGTDSRVVCLSPQGQRFDHAKAGELAQQQSLILIAGRYEGIDERLILAEVDEELSIGDYVVSGGELPAMVVVDAVVRQLQGVLGHELSAEQDSFADGLLDCPHYTRPEQYKGVRVPEVLLSGNHEHIRRWRLKQALGRTWERRPDLLKERALSPEENELLAEYRQEILNRSTT